MLSRRTRLHITTTSLKGIILGGVSAEDFGAVTGISIQESQDILEGLLQNGVGEMRDGFYYFSQGDRLKTAMALLEAGSGASLDEVAAELDWRDFEGLTMEMLASKNFAVMKNLRFKKPAMEIDVVGIRMGVAMLIDCKHWKRNNLSSLDTAVVKQIKRTRRYVAETAGSIAVPVIVTLYQNEIRFIRNVPVVPIAGFSSFVDEFYGNLDDMKTIEAGSL